MQVQEAEIGSPGPYFRKKKAGHGDAYLECQTSKADMGGSL